MTDPTGQEALPHALYLMGPTASGKTDLAVRLVEALPFEIISVDSALIYKGMDIGTAKPDAQTLARAPHRLIDICDPSESYSAARFREDALREMRSITAAGKIPLLVGGTMLYFRALSQGLSPLPSADAEVRARLEREQAERGLPAMHQRLAQVDPEAAARIHQNDPQRIHRALEVYEISGRAMSDLYKQQHLLGLPYRIHKLIVSPLERSELHRRIELRFNMMLEQGFLDEVKTLYERGDLSVDMPSMRAVGYRQAWQYLAGELAWEDMVHKAVVATRQLAKRQYTWLRSEGDAVWLDSQDLEIYQSALKFVQSSGLLLNVSNVL